MGSQPYSSDLVQFEESQKAHSFSGYKMTIATADEADEVYAFYAREKRPSAVVLRDPAVIRKACEDGDFVIVRNKGGKIIAASATYLLNDGKKFESIEIDGTPQNRVTRELGSVMRWGDEYQEGVRPGYLWLTPLFAIPAMVAYWRAYEDERRFDILICNVHNDNPKTANRIRNDSYYAKEQLPLRWMSATATPALIAADEATTQATQDINVKAPTTFFWSSAQHLPLIAKYFTDAATEATKPAGTPNWQDVVLLGPPKYPTGDWKNPQHDQLHIDMSGMPPQFLEMMEILARIPSLINNYGEITISWGESRYHYEQKVQEFKRQKQRRSSNDNDGSPNGSITVMPVPVEPAQRKAAQAAAASLAVQRLG